MYLHISTTVFLTLALGGKRTIVGDFCKETQSCIDILHLTFRENKWNSYVYSTSVEKECSACMSSESLQWRILPCLRRSFIADANTLLLQQTDYCKSHYTA